MLIEWLNLLRNLGLRNIRGTAGQQGGEVPIALFLLQYNLPIINMIAYNAQIYMLGKRE